MREGSWRRRRGVIMWRRETKRTEDYEKGWEREWGTVQGEETEETNEKLNMSVNDQSGRKQRRGSAEWVGFGWYEDRVCGENNTSNTVKFYLQLKNYSKVATKGSQYASWWRTMVVAIFAVLLWSSYTVTFKVQHTSIWYGRSYVCQNIHVNQGAENSVMCSVAVFF